MTHEHTTLNKMKQSVCAVIVSFNSPEDLKNCIDSVFKQVNKIVVVDNSTDPYLKRIIGKFDYSDEVFFILNETNRGLGAALNQGIEYSLINNFQWTLLLDQDSIPSADMVCEMISSYTNLDSELQKETAIIVPVVYDRFLQEEIPPIITAKLFNKKIKNPIGDCFVDFQITSGSLLRNNVIKQIGLMNEELFIDYLDFDLCFRVLNKKNRILLSKNALLHHSLGEKMHKLFFHFIEHSPLRVYYQTRNRLFLLYKYGNKYKSFLYSEIYRFASKPFKILLIESNKREKINMYFRGIVDFIKSYKSFEKTPIIS